MVQLDWIKLDECHLNKYDIEYIERMRFDYLEKLWDRLSKQHFQYFEIKKGTVNRSYPKLYFDVNWQKKTIREISEIYDIKYHTLYSRINNGLSIKQAIWI